VSTATATLRIAIPSLMQMDYPLPIRLGFAVLGTSLLANGMRGMKAEEGDSLAAWKQLEPGRDWLVQLHSMTMRISRDVAERVSQVVIVENKHAG
jgi:hypothetical protein